MKTYTRGLRHIWYDHYLRLWTLQRVDADDCQVGEVEYTTNKKDALEFLKAATPDTVTYDLPARWASFLVLGDASELTPSDLEEVHAFLTRANLRASSCLTCSGDTWFSRHHDATPAVPPGNVTRYVFVLRP